MKKKKKISRLGSAEQGRGLWAEQNSSDYLDWIGAKRVALANMRPFSKTISLRLPESMLEDLKLLANRHDVPYQSLLKIFLAERIEQELRSH
ncbi:MAG: BrnA antitoxin family protein [Deltaproteobacteria bacterium]|nr:BrnA antitoxin family protein [Deltaproteobacteria bacterium]